MFEENSQKKNYFLKKGAKTLLKLTSVALVFTLAISLNSNQAEAKGSKVKAVQKKSNTKKIQTNKKDKNKKDKAVKTSVKPSVVSKVKLAGPVLKAKKFTSLVVMVNSKKVIKGSISPQVISQSGIMVFGDNKAKKNSIAKFVVNEGIKATADTSLEFVKLKKEKPMIVQAIDTINQNGSDYLIISDADALKILIENQASNFMVGGTKIAFLQNTVQETESPFAKTEPPITAPSVTNPVVANVPVENKADKNLSTVTATEIKLAEGTAITPKPNAANVSDTVKPADSTSATNITKPADTTASTNEIKPAVNPAVEVKPAGNNTFSTASVETKPVEAVNTNTTITVKLAEVTNVATPAEVKPVQVSTVSATTGVDTKAIATTGVDANSNIAAKPGDSTSLTATNPSKPTEIASLPANSVPENKSLPEMNTRPLNSYEPPVPTVPAVKNINVANPEKVTSVIIDCSGLGLKRGMSPVVLTATEMDFYPGIIVDGIDEKSLATVMNSGLVTYASSLADARINKVAGSNPMVIRATDIQGILKSDPVIDPVDAAKLISINGKATILTDRKVILVY